MRRLVLLLVAVSWAAPALAQPDAAALDAARKRFAAGQKLFDAGDMRGAVDEFKEAYRLTHNPLLLYNIAFVYDKMDDVALALHFYSRFIDEAEDNDKNHERLVDAGKRAAELRARLQAEEPTSQPASGPASAPASAPARITGLVHEVVDQAPPGKPIDVTARVPDEAGWTVTLFYRGAGEDLYQQVRMRPRLGVLVGRIPAAAVRGNAVHYFITARDPEGKVVASAGKASTPNLVYLDPGAPVHAILEPAEVPGAAVAPAPIHAEAPSPPRGPYFYAKWTASGAAVVMLGASVAFALGARSQADTLEAQANKSQSGDCPPFGPPCQQYSAPFKEVEQTGKSYQRWSNVLLVGGAATAVAAGVFWYLDAGHEDRPRAAPMVGGGTVGATAVVPF